MPAPPITGPFLSRRFAPGENVILDGRPSSSDMFFPEFKLKRFAFELTIEILGPFLGLIFVLFFEGRTSAANRAMIPTVSPGLFMLNAFGWSMVVALNVMWFMADNPTMPLAYVAILDSFYGVRSTFISMKYALFPRAALARLREKRHCERAILDTLIVFSYSRMDRAVIVSELAQAMEATGVDLNTLAFSLCRSAREDGGSPDDSEFSPSMCSMSSASCRVPPSTRFTDPYEHPQLALVRKTAPDKVGMSRGVTIAPVVAMHLEAMRAESASMGAVAAAGGARLPNLPRLAPSPLRSFGDADSARGRSQTAGDNDGDDNDGGDNDDVDDNGDRHRSRQGSVASAVEAFGAGSSSKFIFRRAVRKEIVRSAPGMGRSMRDPDTGAELVKVYDVALALLIHPLWRSGDAFLALPREWVLGGFFGRMFLSPIMMTMMTFGLFRGLAYLYMMHTDDVADSTYDLAMGILGVMISFMFVGVSLNFVVIGLQDRIRVQRQAAHLNDLLSCGYRVVDGERPLVLDPSVVQNYLAWLHLRNVLDKFGTTYSARLQAYNSFFAFYVLAVSAVMVLLLFFFPDVEMSLRTLATVSIDLVLFATTNVVGLLYAVWTTSARAEHARSLTAVSLAARVSGSEFGGPFPPTEDERLTKVSVTTAAIVKLLDRDAELSPIKILGVPANLKALSGLGGSALAGIFAALRLTGWIKF